MNPSHVRERILKDHEELRARLRRLEGAVDAMEREPAQLAAVIETARGLVEEVVRHTELEDLILGAALFEIDAWGPVRAQLLRQHHEKQRAELRSLLETYARAQPAATIARLTLDWVRELRSDMNHEESDILTRTLLRDDPIAVDMEAG